MNEPRPSRPHAVLAALASLALAAAYGGCSGGGAKAGDVGEDCYPNGTCNAGLDCKAGTCVASNGNGGAGGHTGATASSSSNGSSGTGGSATSSSGSSTTSSSGTSSSTSASSSGAASGPPVIVSLGSNVTSITEGESVTITAIVTDPDGIDDVIGGDLGDGASATYGAFSTTSQEGSYQMTLSWAQFQQVASIDFAQGADEPRVLVATFYDQAAHQTQKSITITLDCNGDGACAGTCKDMSADAKNCGTCGKVCPVGASCSQSTCMCPTNDVLCSGVCTNLQSDSKNCGTCGHACATSGCYQGKCGTLSACTSGGTNCNAVCQSLGKTCVDLCIGVGGTPDTAAVIYQSLSCSASAAKSDIASCIANIAGTTSAKCCCF